MKKIVLGIMIVLAFLTGIFVTQLALTNKQQTDLPVLQPGTIFGDSFFKENNFEDRF